MTKIVNGVEIEDTFAEAFKMWGARVIITAKNRKWALEAATKMTGFATSVIGCKCEAGIEAELDDTWMLFYNANNAGEKFRPQVAGGSSIGVTTATDPTGPWSPGQQVLTTGGSGEWDSEFIIPNSIVTTEDGYRMYYSAGPDPAKNEMMCGMATSTDGITWTKYDDPATTQAPFAESDPVLQPGPANWEALMVQCRVLKTDTGWEMFYHGWGGGYARVGYAFSPDGVQWTKYQDNPLKIYLVYPYAIKENSTYYLYGQDLGSSTLKVAMATIDHP